MLYRFFISFFIVVVYFSSSISVFAIVRLDSDNDGLQDHDEIIYGTDKENPDTDGDGYRDGIEARSGYDPRSADPKKLIKRIEVDLSEQRLRYYLGDIQIRSTKVSTGKSATPTPIGEFSILNKSPRAWSRIAKLWMPYWMGFASGKYGLHELPEWPGGRKEGANHLGTPVSGGCVRLGIGEAKKMYDWTPVGTKLIITK